MSILLAAKQSIVIHDVCQLNEKIRIQTIKCKRIVQYERSTSIGKCRETAREKRKKTLSNKIRQKRNMKKKRKRLMDSRWVSVVYIVCPCNIVHFNGVYGKLASWLPLKMALHLLSELIIASIIHTRILIMCRCINLTDRENLWVHARKRCAAPTLHGACHRIVDVHFSVCKCIIYCDVYASLYRLCEKKKRRD